MKKIGAKLFEAIGYTLAIFVIIVATMASISTLLTPALNNHRADFEQWAGQYLGYPIHIGAIDLTWFGYEPEIDFDQVIVFDKTSQKPKLEIRHIKVDVDLWRTIWTRQIQPANLVLEGARLAIYQQASGQINVQGFMGFNMKDTLTGASVKIDEVLKAIFSQPRIALRDIDISYYPAKGAMRWLTLHKLILKNDTQKHKLFGKVILHQEIPTTMQIAFDWMGDVSNMSSIDANLYFYLEGLSLPQWAENMSFGGFKVQEGLVTAKIWADWNHNQWQKVQTSLELYDLELKSINTHQSENIERMRGDVDWKRDGDNQILAGEQLFIDFPDHLWQATNFYITYNMDASGQYVPKTARIDYLNVDDLKRIALESSLLSDDYRKMLATFNPTGNLYKIDTNFKGNYTDLSKMTLSAGFSGLSFNANNVIPSISNLTGEFGWDGNSGSLKLNSQQSSVSIKQIFENPLTWDTVTGDLSVHKDDNNVWTLTAKQLNVANADVKISADASIVISPTASTLVDMTANFSVADVTAISNYLPLKVFDPDLQQWLKSAFHSGQLTSGVAVMKGNLKDYPYDQGGGNFKIAGVVKDITFKFAPDWPEIENGEGAIAFSKSSMVVDITSGTIGKIPIKHARGIIPYIGDKAPQVLAVVTDINADAASGLEFIRNSPLADTLGKQFTGTTLSGPLALGLSLSVPLKHPDKTRVLGNATLTNAEMDMPAWKLKLSQINGGFQFTEDSMHATNIEGKLFGAPARIDITTETGAAHHGQIRADVANTITMNQLQQVLNVPLAKTLQGQAAFLAHIYFSSPSKAEGTEVIASSNLQGVSIDLPAPFGKEAQQTKKLQLDVMTQNHVLSQIKLSYDDLITASINLQGTKAGQHSYLVNLENSDIEGQIVVPANFHFQTLQGNFKRCHFGTSNMLSGRALDPKMLPAINVTCDDLRYGLMEFGQITINAVPSENGLDIRSLHLTSPTYTLVAAGEWTGSGKHQHSHLDGNLNATHVSGLLNQLGFSTSNLEASKGSTDFNLSWSGAPYKPTIEGLSGELSIKLDKGRVVELSNESNAKMGIGRMLNIFSLSAIPRRLGGDFSDLTEKGYGFDSAKGTFSFKNGNAYTTNTHFAGPIADLDIAGRIGLEAKDYDITLSVTPYVTASLPVVATIAGGPLVGAATWVMGKVISAGVSKVVTYHYSVTGTWDNPSWNQIGVNAAPHKNQ